MAFGMSIFDANGSQNFVDTPFWVIDMQSSLNGSGSLSYSFDTGLFNLDVIKCLWKYGQTPNVSISGNTISYSNAANLWLIIKLVRK